MRAWLYSLAIKEAFKSKYPQFRHGAVASANNVVVAKASNRKFPMSYGAGAIYSQHAETSTINKCNKSIVGGSVYVVRINKQGRLANSKPCTNCELAMRKAGIKKVYYSISPEEYGVLNLWS